MMALLAGAHAAAAPTTCNPAGLRGEGLLHHDVKHLMPGTFQKTAAMISSRQQHVACDGDCVRSFRDTTTHSPLKYVFHLGGLFFSFIFLFNLLQKRKKEMGKGKGLIITIITIFKKTAFTLTFHFWMIQDTLVKILET